MDPSNQEVYFVELDGLDGESYTEVVSILHGDRHSKKVEFPWENKLEKDKDESNDLQEEEKESLPEQPNEVLIPATVESPQILVPYAIVPPGVVPIPAALAQYPIPPTGMVNGVHAPFPPNVLPDGSLLQTECIIEMPSPAKSDHGNYYTHCNRPVMPPGFDCNQGQQPIPIQHNMNYNDAHINHIQNNNNEFSREESPGHQVDPEEENSVSFTIQLPSESFETNQPETPPKSTKPSLDQAIKSSRIFNQVLGNSEPSTGISFLADDTLADDSGISFFCEDQLGDLESSSKQKEENDYYEPEVLIGNIEVTVCINNHENTNTDVKHAEYSETVYLNPYSDDNQQMEYLINSQKEASPEIETVTLAPPPLVETPTIAPPPPVETPTSAPPPPVETPTSAPPPPVETPTSAPPPPVETPTLAPPPAATKTHVVKQKPVKPVRKEPSPVKSNARNSPRESPQVQSPKENSLEPAPFEAPAAPKSKSWAGLFKATPTRSTVVYADKVPNITAPIVTAPTINKKKEHSPSPVPANEDSATSELGALLSHIKLNHASVALQPRGLINNSNWCYINATLQALIACPPFYHLMKKLSDFPPMSRGSSATPILDSLLQFTCEFNIMPRHYEMNGHNKNDRIKKIYDIEPGHDFEPKYIHNMLHVIEVNPAFKLGKQEDAEEFLSILLDGLHEEMAAAINSKDLKNNNTEPQTNGVYEEDEDDDDDEDGDSWEQVGPKNKSVVTRRATFSKTPISDIFAGQMRSVVSKTGSKESATLQPYFTLQLDIQGKVFSVRDALEGLVSKEIVGDYFDKKTNQKIEILRKTTLEELPPVLILHLKCFVYNSEGSQKLLRNIEFDVDLKITKDLVSPTAKIPNSHKSYKLFAVVYHHGVKSSGGHYTCAVFHPGINGWINMDDRRIETVNVQKVLKYNPPRMPYLLYYRRTDLAYS